MNKLYYHFFIPEAPSNWELLLYEQLDCIEGSDLLYNCHVELCVLSNEENYDKVLTILRSYKNINYTWFNLNNDYIKNFGEGNTLLKLYDELDSYENIAYIHSKSITSISKQTNRWRKVLEYGVIEKWNDNIQSLENGYDASGILWLGNHFSGNFWWAKSSYLKRLPRPVLEKWDCCPADNFWNTRVRYEFWIGLMNPKVNIIYPNKDLPVGIGLYNYSIDIKRNTVLNY
jgi:hypothetical protein